MTTMTGDAALTIRDATPDDIPALARYIAMAEGEMAHFFAGGDDPALVAETFARLMRAPAPCRYSLEFTRVAELGGRTAGAVVAFPADRQPELDRPLLATLRERGHDLDRLFFEGEPGTYYLSTMGVDSVFRGRGIGQALMTAAEARGKQAGYAQCSLLVEQGKERVRSLYERRGYAVRASVRIGGLDYFRMIGTPA